MDRIILEVDDIAARNWRSTTQEKKLELTNTINQILNKALDKSDEDFFAFLDNISRKAQANGLTDEILNKLLNEE
jgi:ABC-type amino acid transport substrate-binding protein